MRTQLITLKSFILCWGLVVSSFVNAALVEVDHAGFGEASFTLDTSTGLYWLDISASQGMSVNQVSGALGAGGVFEGLRRATDIEVQGLWSGAGISFSWSDFSRTPTAPNYTPISNLQGLIGITQTFGPSSNPDYDGADFTGAFYSRFGSDFNNAAYLYSNSGTGNGFYDPSTGLNDSTQYANIGTYLVTTELPTTVPVPAAAWLFSSAILGLNVIRKKKP